MMNQVAIEGTVTGNPLFQKTEKGIDMVLFHIACDQDGTEWTDTFPCVAYEKCAASLQGIYAGEPISIVGRLRNSKRTEADGTSRTITQIRVARAYRIGGLE